jgi:hypothetical protein
MAVTVRVGGKDGLTPIRDSRGNVFIFAHILVSYLSFKISKKRGKDKMAHAHHPLMHHDSKEIKSESFSPAAQASTDIESAMPQEFTRPLANLINGYLGGDIVINWTGDGKDNPFTKKNTISLDFSNICQISPWKN